MTNDRGRPVQNRVAIVLCLIVLLSSAVTILRSRPFAPHNGGAVGLSVFAAIRLFLETRKPKFRRPRG